MSESEILIQQFIARGGQITKCPPGLALDCQFIGGKVNAREAATKVHLKRESNKGKRPAAVEIDDE